MKHDQGSPARWFGRRTQAMEAGVQEDIVQDAFLPEPGSQEGFSR